MKVILFLFLTCSVLADEPAPKCCYISRAIACDENEERYVSDIYESFLNLLSGEILKSGSLSFPAHFAKLTPSYACIEWDYYVTPNEFKGIEILIPRTAIATKDGMISITADLRLKSKSWRQACRTLQLEAIQPNQPIVPTPIAVTPPARQAPRRP